MTDTDNKDKYASEFMVLWQKQLQSLMVNPDISGDFFSKMSSLQSDMVSKSSGGKNAEHQANDSDISEHGNDELSKLKHRLAACEARITALEARIKD